MSDIYLAIPWLCVNIYIFIRASRRAWQLRNDRRNIGRSTKMYLLGIAGHNVFAGGVFIASATMQSFYLHGVSIWWWYVAANALEVIPFVILDVVLDRTPSQNLLDSTEAQLEKSLIDIRKIRQSNFYATSSNETKRILDEADDSLGNLVTQLTLRRQTDNLRNGG